MSQDDPLDPVSAATHADPYPYYAALRARPALEFHPSVKAWVAARAGVVAEVLAHPQCRVRPAAEPVPRGIAGGAAGQVFSRLVRMNEGPAHAAGKRAIEASLAPLEPAALQAFALEQAQALTARFRLDEPAQLNAWAFELPLHCVARLIGLQPGPALGDAMQRFVACLSPLSTPAQLAAAHEAAQALLQQVRALRSPAWADAEALAANLVGLMSQTYEATAGLVGNTLVALLQRPALLQRLREQPDDVGAAVREVSRFDPSVQNTRRFVHEPIMLCGAALQPGDTVLVLLAAAARDPAAGPGADRLNPWRESGPIAGFGAGRHACPGQTVALALATGAVTHLVHHAPHLLNPGTLRWRYRPSVNARIPEFERA